MTEQRKRDRYILFILRAFGVACRFVHFFLSIFPVLSVIIIIVVIKDHHCVCELRFMYFRACSSVLTSRDWFSLVSPLLYIEFRMERKKTKIKKKTRRVHAISLCTPKIIPFFRNTRCRDTVVSSPLLSLRTAHTMEYHLNRFYNIIIEWRKKKRYKLQMN